MSAQRLRSAEIRTETADLTFSEFPEGTTITDEYVPKGVVFDSGVFITGDGSNPTSPVLSGDPTFEGPVEGHSSVPGSLAPATVNGFDLDVGYINQRNSTEVAFFDRSGKQLGSTPAQSLGINHLEIRHRGIASFVVRTISAEEAGFAIDNLELVRGAEGSDPTRMASFGDSYSSGEGLTGSGGTRYDCATAMTRQNYRADTTVLGNYPIWFDSACDTRTLSNKRPADLLERPVKAQENRCHRHGRAYPNAIRSRLGISVRDAIVVTCSGALTADVLRNGQYSVPGSPKNIHGGRSQLSTVKAFANGGAPDFITIGIGGNDAHFADIIKHCMWTACTQDPSWQDGVLTRVRTVMLENVRTTLDRLREDFPGATIAAFGYPSVIGNPTSDCGSFRVDALRLRIEEPERYWLKYTVFPAINQSLRDAAQEAGVTFIDISDVTSGHEICSPTPWINGIRYLSTDTFNPVASESFHPNELAHDAIAAGFMRDYVQDGRLIFTNPAPQPVIRPDAGTRISMGSVDARSLKQGGEQACLQGCPITIQGQGYVPGSTVRLSVRPVASPSGRARQAGSDLSPADVGADGSFASHQSMPATVAPGVYVVEVGGTSPDGTEQYGDASVEVFARDPGPAVAPAVRVKPPARPVVRRGSFVALCQTSGPFSTCSARIALRASGKVIARASKVTHTRDRQVGSLRFSFSKTELRSISRSLRKRKVTATITVRLRDARSQTATASRSVILRRR